ncbi:MAG: hypothetical protein DMF40_01210 [Verrucomicrobia bacterium]|nr:MAG: hypothetical protein DMF40_01210 [Verrucomicrobiota bacterium]
MHSRESIRPFLFFFLDLPSGISSGFASITLPFVLTQAGFSVAAASAIVALGVSANLWRFLWGPVADLTLTARRWYLIGLITTAATLFLLSVIPLRTSSSGLTYAVVFISQVASTLVMLPLGGMMAHTVAEEAKGRAAGWYQAGNLGGNGIGGGAGVWLAAHYSKEIAGAALAISMLACALALLFVADVRIVTTETLRQRMLLLWRDLVAIVTAAIPLLVTILVCSPIGAGATNNVWAAVAPDWHASADMVALVTGVLNGVVAAVGCVVGGWIADRVGFWWTYFTSGIAIAAVAIIMAIAARTPASFSVGVLFYAFTNGVAYAAFSALVLLAIGKGAASTKYAALCSLGNLPVVYMTALDGWVHDRYGTAWMLHFDGLAGVVCIAFAMLALHRILRRQATLIP